MPWFLWQGSGSNRLLRARISELERKVASEHQKVLNDPKAIMPVSFVMFDSRWGAAVCTQTQQSKNPTQWLTDWAPEPRDVYWQNLAIPFFSLSIRRFLIYRICAITCQSWGSWKGCSISEAGNRSKCGKILPSGVSSRFGSEDLSLYPPYSFSDHVKSWRLCIFIIVGKEDCFEILLLHAGECIPWKHNRWYSIWTAIRFPPSVIMWSIKNTEKL